MTVLSMSRAEIDRVHVLKDLLAERIRTAEAAQLLGVTGRQVFRLWRTDEQVRRLPGMKPPARPWTGC